MMPPQHTAARRGIPIDDWCLYLQRSVSCKAPAPSSRHTTRTPPNRRNRAHKYHIVIGASALVPRPGCAFPGRRTSKPGSRIDIFAQGRRTFPMRNEARHPNTLSPEQRAELDAFMRSPSTPKRLVDRARIIWLARDGASTKSVAQGLSLTSLTVSKWKRRYRVAGIAGLYDLARPGQPRKLTAERRDEIIRYTRQAIPEHGTRWSIRQMAVFAGVTQHQVRQIWNAARLTPATSPSVPLDRQIDRGLWELCAVTMDAQRTLAVFQALEPIQGGEHDRTAPPLSRGERSRARGSLAVLHEAFRLASSGTAREVGGKIADLKSNWEGPSGESTHLLICNGDDQDLVAEFFRASAGVVNSLPTVADWLERLDVYCSRLRALTRGGSPHRNVFEFRRALDVYVKRYRG